MIKNTGDVDTVWGLALGRDREGNLADFQIGMPKEVALEHYDRLQAHALLRMEIEVMSSIDMQGS